MDIGEIFLPIIDKTLGAVAWMLHALSGNTAKWIFGIIGVAVGLKLVVVICKGLFGVLGSIKNILFSGPGSITGALKKLPEFFKNAWTSITTSVKKMGSAVSGGFKNFMKNVSEGLGYFGTAKIKKAAINILILSASLIPLALALKILQGVDFKAVGVLAVSLGALLATMWVLSKLPKKEIIEGALALAIVGASLIPLAYAMKMFESIKLETLGIAALALIGLTAAVFGLGALLSTGVGGAIFTVGVIGIAALGVALIPFAAAAWLAAEAVDLMSDAFNKVTPSLIELSKIGGTALIGTAAGIGAISLALASFGAGSAVAGIGSFIGGFLGGDPIKKLKTLVELSEPLKVVASSMSILSDSLRKFSELDASKISNVVGSLSKLKDLGPISMNAEFRASTNTTPDNLNGLVQAKPQDINGLYSGVTQSTQEIGGTVSGNSNDVLNELKGLRADLASGKIAVNMDGQLVSTTMNRGINFRGQYGAIS
jgi:hypothetical protein